MKMTVPIILAICFIGCASTDKYRDTDSCRDGGKIPPAGDSQVLVIYDFSQGSEPRGWEVEDDVVMGGRSEGAFSLNQEGNAVFSGNVSLENNGGFSSVQYDFDPIDAVSYTHLTLPTN